MNRNALIAAGVAIVLAVAGTFLGFDLKANVCGDAAPAAAAAAQQ